MLPVHFAHESDRCIVYRQYHSGGVILSQSHRLGNVVLLLVLTILAAATLVSASPLAWPAPERDSGLFLYTGARILEGDIPYRDVWDHKPPAIYYINALAVLIGNRSLWSIWFVEFIAVWSAGILGFILLSRYFGILAAGLGSIIWIVQLGPMVDNGNYTELFALPVQLAALFLVFRAHPERHGPITWIVAGALATVAFLLKQPLIGIWVSLALLLVYLAVTTGDWRSLVARGGAMFGGAATVALLVCIYFLANGVLYDFWDQAFRYNLAYADTVSGTSRRIEAIRETLRTSFPTGLARLALAGWLIALIRVLRHLPSLDPRNQLLFVALIDVPLELALSGLSGRGYLHYYIPWLPAFAILASFIAWSVLTLPLSLPRTSFLRWSLLVLGLGVFGFVLVRTSETLYLQVGKVSEPLPLTEQRHIVADYVQTHSREGEYVLMWGADAGVNFSADRPSPTRFVYQYPLYTYGYQDSSMVYEFLNDIKRHEPVLIVDAWNGTDKVPPLDPVPRAHWKPPWGNYYQPLPEMQAVFDYVASHYEPIEVVGPGGWTVFRRLDKTKQGRASQLYSIP